MLDDLKAQRNLANKYESLLLDMSSSHPRMMASVDVSMGQLDDSTDVRSEEGETVQYIPPLQLKPYMSAKVSYSSSKPWPPFVVP